MAGDLRRCPTLKLEAHNNRVTSCRWSSGKSLLATGSQDGTVRLWSITKTSGEIVCTLSFNTRYPNPDPSYYTPSPSTPGIQIYRHSYRNIGNAGQKKTKGPSSLFSITQ
nr:PREDICTED: probable E3 ubiquitin-protein ligase HERC1 [Latimeria chalumnae]|eukprot:XP_014339927.1 PREDICTED: probable E3 ubiquitin-protein ligase HERC1 [Latimeria chalumnae]